MIAKTKEEITALREGGKRLGAILRSLGELAQAGMTTRDLDTLAREQIEVNAATPAFLGYTPQGAKRAYPAVLCTSINNEVVHGIPNEAPRTLKAGDIIAFDLGLMHEGLIVDAAVTIGIGSIDEGAKRLIAATKKALAAGIAAARIGNTIGDISFAIGESVKRSGFAVANELGGHGVGRRVHEEPYIPNWGKKGAGERIVAGMVLALEPIVNEGTGNTRLMPDGYTIVTRDGKRSAHFEHTILITKGDAEILTGD